MTTTTTRYHLRDQDDDMSLADMMSLRISNSIPEEKKAPTMWNDWTIAHNELYQQQLQSSYYQLQYLQQQQMMAMMRNNDTCGNSRRSSTVSSTSTTTTSSSKYSHNNYWSLPSAQLSPSSSTSSVYHRPSITKNNNNTKNNSTTILIQEPPKRRQSLGKRIKKVFGMTATEAVELPSQLRVDTNYSASLKHKKKVIRSAIIPDSPDSSISSSSVSTISSNNSSIKKKLQNRRYYEAQHQLPSPALSTVSTNSTTTTTSSITTASTPKKTLSFNTVIQMHDTFSASEYDRRCDTTATCQKLSPVLALKIKEELNNYKLNDMFVHAQSRQNTHFFM